MASDKFIKKLDLSNLHFYSVGIVARDKDWNTSNAEIYPVEIIPDYGEDITAEPVADKVKVPMIDKDNKTKYEDIVIKKDKSIVAKWLSFGQYNRITAPDLRKGEQVLLWQFSNSDIFFWTTMLNNINLRTEEIAIYAWSDKTKINPNEKIEDTYYLEINTKDKIVKFHTPNQNGEYTTYDFIMDTKNGDVKLIDGKNNYLELNSATDTVTINTNNEIDIISTNKVNIQTTDVNINASNSATITANNNINTTTSAENKLVNGKYSLSTGGLSISGNSVELISTLIELVNYIISEQHVGNLGINTNLSDGSVSNYNSILSKLNTLKG